MEKNELLEKLQFVYDSGWTIINGALPAETLMVECNDLNGDIMIDPIFDNVFHDYADMHYNWTHRKNKSPTGDLCHMHQSPYEIRFALKPSTPIDRENRIRGTYTGKYCVYRHKESGRDYMESILQNGFRFDYDSEKRIFIAR